MQVAEILSSMHTQAVWCKQLIQNQILSRKAFISVMVSEMVYSAVSYLTMYASKPLCSAFFPKKRVVFETSAT